MKKIRIWSPYGALLLLLLILAACGSSLTKGYVTQKQDIPAHTYIYLQPIPHESCEYVNKTEECTTTFTYIPTPRYVPEEWKVDISSCPPNQQQSNCETAEYDVSQSTYNQVQVGQYVDFSNQ